MKLSYLINKLNNHLHQEGTFAYACSLLRSRPVHIANACTLAQLVVVRFLNETAS